MNDFVQRLYVVVNGKLTCGQKTAQAIHAVAEFAVNAPDSFREWTENGNIIVVLETPNVYDLIHLRESLRNDGFTVYDFHEEDFGEQLTGFTVKPDPLVQPILAGLPLVHCSNKSTQHKKHHSFIKFGK